MKSLAQNQLKNVRKLLQKKFREEERKFIVEGWRSVEEAMLSDWHIEMLIFSNEHAENENALKIFSHAEQNNIPFFSISPKEFEQISDTETPQGILAVAHQKKMQLTNYDSYNFVVAFDAVSDPGNLGTMLRACDWFGVDAILLGKNCVELFNQKVVRASMGSLFHLPIFTDVNLAGELNTLQSKKYRVLSASVKAKQSLFSISFPKKTVVLFGNEAHGISSTLENISDTLFSIPQFGKAESLNVSAACAAVLAVWRSSL
ncbi:MAG: RNA methyltransferase [Bacteroidota bacterium]